MSTDELPHESHEWVDVEGKLRCNRCAASAMWRLGELPCEVHGINYKRMYAKKKPSGRPKRERA